MLFNKFNIKITGIKRSSIATVVLVLVSVFPMHANVTLPKILGHNMVLQRGKHDPVWGTADPGEHVTVTFAGQTKSTVAGANGNWEVKLNPLKASFQPREMVITGKNKIVLKNILVGEVWLCSGQSNMEYAMRKMTYSLAHTRGKTPAENDLLTAHNKDIRIFLDRRKFMKPEADHHGWAAAMGEDTPAKGIPLRDFSAAGYYFAKTMFAKLHVPIGMISAAVPGSRIEPWVQASKLAISPKLRNGKVLKPLTADGGDPGKFYVTMIRPLIPYSIRGFLWYQGESNCFLNETIRYAYKFKTLIESWRKDWGDMKLPFYYVQIAPYVYSQSHDVRPHNVYNLPEFWEAQALLLKLPNTGMITITDLNDNIKNLHPHYKWEVGRRLALLAFHNVYGMKNIVCSGPSYNKMKIEGNEIVVSFKHTGSGLASRDGKPLTWFDLAGKDGKYYPAKAVIEGNKVVVSANEVPHPVNVRFAWNEAAQSNFINKEGLPAVPFRSDNPWVKLFK